MGSWDIDGTSKGCRTSLSFSKMPKGMVHLRRQPKALWPTQPRPVRDSLTGQREQGRGLHPHPSCHAHVVAEPQPEHSVQVLSVTVRVLWLLSGRPSMIKVGSHDFISVTGPGPQKVSEGTLMSLGSKW